MAGAVHEAGLPVATRSGLRRPTNLQVWSRGGRPVVTAVRVMVCPTPTSGGMKGELVMCGTGSRTTKVLVTVALQPAELQLRKVTCLTPGVEKVTLGLATMEVEVAAW